MLKKITWALFLFLLLTSNVSYGSTRCHTDAYGYTRCKDSDGNSLNGHTDSYGNSRFRDDYGNSTRCYTDSYGNTTCN
jgi:hypothetical protein